MSDLEGTVGYSLPKICVLFPMVVGSRRIADDTETDERYLIYITDLGDGSRFHIYCQPSWNFSLMSLSSERSVINLSPLHIRPP